MTFDEAFKADAERLFERVTPLERSTDRGSTWERLEWGIITELAYQDKSRAEELASPSGLPLSDGSFVRFVVPVPTKGWGTGWTAGGLLHSPGGAPTKRSVHSWEKAGPGQPDDPFYSVMRLVGDGMAALREIFPDGEADDMNAVLFSTSGVHGSYCLIEAVEQGLQNPGTDEPTFVTFCVIQPRIVCMRYGNAEPQNADDIAFLKKLRASSLSALSRIGVPSVA